jgi:hypothetical protein
LNSVKEKFLLLEPLVRDGDSDPWADHRLSIREHAVHGDVEDFLRWATIQATMYVGDAPYIKVEAEALFNDDPERWGKAITDPGVGDAPLLPWLPWANSNLIHQAYHIYVWERETGKRIDEMKSIFELGGGYGALALVIRRLGFDGKYMILDFPEMHILQDYFLGECGIEFDKITKPPKPVIDLYIALYSLAEIPVSMRPDYLPGFARSHLIAYGQLYDDINNEHYFRMLAKNYPRWHCKDWKFIINEHIKDTCYLIGGREIRTTV